MRAEQRSKLQAATIRNSFSRRSRDGSNTAAALKVLCAKKTNKANVGWTGHARRGRYGHGRRPGLRGRPGRDPTSMEVSTKRFTRPADPVGCHGQGKFLGVRNINFFHPGIVFWLHYRPRAQISNHGRALVTIVNSPRNICIWPLNPQKKKKNSHFSSGKKKIRSKKKIRILTKSRWFIRTSRKIVFVVMNFHYFVIFWERKFEKIKVFFNGKMCVFSQKKTKKQKGSLLWNQGIVFFK
jgi:hypothetical protein